LAPRIGNARLEPALLLVVAYFQPQLDQDRAPLDDELLELRTELQEPLVLLRRAEAHDRLDAGAVVPAAIEDHHFAPGREVLQVALHIDLGLFAVRWSGECHDPEHTRADTLGDRPDRPPLAGAVAAFEQDHHAEPL